MFDNGILMLKMHSNVLTTAVGFQFPFAASQLLCCLTFPQHRAVVEAIHPKNAPFGYLEASQFKNSRVTTGLNKIPEGNKI